MSKPAISSRPIWRRYDRLLGPDPAADVKAELRFHIESKTEDLIRLGWRPEAARKEAERQFGNILAVQHIGERMGGNMERRRRLNDYANECLQDIRYTLRTLGRNRSFTAVAILVLALGIGVNIAVFSVVNTLLLRPLPFPDSQKLVWFTGGKSIDAKVRAAAGLSGQTFTVDAYREYQRNNQSFQALTSYQTFYGSLQYKLTGISEPKQLSAVEVADNFFPTLGVQPAIGRNFTQEETLKGGRPAAMLSYFYWKTQFHSDSSIIGNTISVNGSPVTIVGILPPSFDFGTVFAPGMKVDVFVPAVMDFWKTWGNTLAIVGRLKPGVTVAQAQDEADRLFPLLKSLHKDWYEDYASDLTTLKDHVGGKLRRSLVALWSAVGLILLIVCVNLSNLQLSRAATRNKEFAMRRALGANRGRLIRQLLTESLVLSIAGAALGLGFAYGIVYYLAHQTSITLPLLATIGVDGEALAWTLLIALGVGILFGLAPAFKISGGNLQDALKDNAAGMAAGRSHERFRSTLVISEIALACVLLVGAGLLLRSFLKVLDVDLGFEPSRAAAISLDYNDNGDPVKRGVFDREVLHRIQSIPGVQTAGITDSLPMSRNRSWDISAKGKHYEPGELPGTFAYVVTPGYLNAIGMRLVKGRDMTWEDNDPKQAVVIINETVAHYLWPNEDPIDRIASIGGSDARVIGVIADVRETTAEAKSGWQMYVSAVAPQFGPQDPQLVIRSSLPAKTLQPTALAALRQFNPGQPVADLKPIQLLVDHASSPRRFFVYLVGIFAGLGLILASLGIYGVISYSVTQRTQEIGIRVALGATLARVQFDVIRATLQLALIGIAIGTLASLAASSLIASLLFGTTPTDPITFLGMVFVLGSIALLAGYIPARRASRINPMVALRNN